MESNLKKILQKNSNKDVYLQNFDSYYQIKTNQAFSFEVSG